MNNAIVTEVEVGSKAHSSGIAVGDALVSINGEKIGDVLDYRFFSADPLLKLTLNRSGVQYEVCIDNEEGQDIGLTLSFGDAGQTKRCQNRCIFCFIDQMPSGMRESLYLKDDDVRLSFLTGSYITLTNLSEKDIRRILHQKISPVNVSVHTVEKRLRVDMLKNKKAGGLYKLMKRLAKGGITMNCQVVLVKHVNDGKHLNKTIGKLLRLYPQVLSLSVVPVGLTKYRECLPQIEPFDAKDAAGVIDQIEAWQQKAKKRYGVSFVYASDEFYLKAGRSFPPEESYDGYPQIENGVGMITSFTEEAALAMKDALPLKEARHIGVITGMAAERLMKETADKLHQCFPQLTVSIYPIRNDFFGHTVTVSGLVCGCDVMAQLAGKPLPKEMLMPEVMFRSGTDIMLDDVTREQLEKTLHTRIRKIKTDGFSTVRAMLGD